MKKLTVLGLSLGMVSGPAIAGGDSASPGGDPSSLRVKVYAVYASTSAQCTNPTRIFQNDAGGFVDFLTSPTLGDGDLADGTYNCVIIKMSSIIKHTPLTTATSCVAGTEYTGGVCNAADSATDLDNAPIACSGDGSNAGSVDNTVYMYLTTDSAASLGHRAFVHPVTAGDGNGIHLGSPLVISSTSRAKFVVNATGKVVAGGGECGINAPLFSFENL
jgi:hypothetical protein